MFEAFEKSVKQTKTPWLVFTAAAFCFTVFLFYIDEGNYSFKGFLSPYTWVVLFIYVVPQIVMQFLLFGLLKKKLNSKESTLFSVILGVILGVALVICSFYLIG